MPTGVHGLLRNDWRLSNRSGNTSLVTQMRLHQDFREFLTLLNENGVDYLIIGGYAVVMHGYVRATGDIDIWIKNSTENSKRLVSVLNKFGFASLNIKEEDFLKPDHVIQLGYPPYRIDLLTSIEGLRFDTCFRKRKKIRVDKNLTVNVIDIESLKKSKRIAGRKRDLDDLENLT